MENVWFYLSVFLIFLYSISLILVLFYSLSQLNLLWNYIQYKKKKENPVELDLNDLDAVPLVTIQLPVFNEIYVIERLLECINLIEYPRTKLEIQVLDDSTDESVGLIENLVKKLRKEGLDIVQIRREKRIGFKAGALKEGLEIAKGEFIAIFDADFLPKSNWLLQTIPHFKDKKIGVVQTRWSHINRDYSILTQIQAFALDAHFTLEQVGRNSKKPFYEF